MNSQDNGGRENDMHYNMFSRITVNNIEMEKRTATSTSLYTFRNIDQLSLKDVNEVQ